MNKTEKPITKGSSIEQFNLLPEINRFFETYKTHKVKKTITILEIFVYQQFIKEKPNKIVVSPELL
jgi:hypothetical protein